MCGSIQAPNSVRLLYESGQMASESGQSLRVQEIRRNKVCAQQSKSLIEEQSPEDVCIESGTTYGVCMCI